MKIALINSEFSSLSGKDHGGIATYSYTLANLLVNHGHTVHLLSASAAHAGEIEPTVKIVHITYQPTRKSFLPQILRPLYTNSRCYEECIARSLQNILYRILNDEGLDIVEYPDYGGLGIHCHHLAPLPSLVTLHTPSVLVDELNCVTPSSHRKVLYALEKKAILRATACKSPSHALKQYVCHKFKLPESSVTTLHNPFNVSAFQRMYDSFDNESSSTTFDILFAGRLEYRKGAAILANSIKAILSISNRIRIIIAGETEIAGQPNYHRKINEVLTPEQQSRTVFYGPLSRNKLLLVYKSSSLFFFPSLFENAPYTLLEAMACGLPVLALASGGVNEIITHGENGLLFSLNDPHEPIPSIKFLFENRTESQRIGRNAAESINRIYATEKTVDAYISFYRSIIGK